MGAFARCDRCGYETVMGRDESARIYTVPARWLVVKDLPHTPNAAFCVECVKDLVKWSQEPPIRPELHK